MSAIATLLVVEAQSVAAATDVAAADATAGREVGDFGWSGYVLLDLMLYLKKRGIVLTDLENGRGGVTRFVITPAHQRYLDRLDPDGHDMDRIASFFRRKGLELDAIEAAEAAREGLELLREHISALAPNEVLVVDIG